MRIEVHNVCGVAWSPPGGDPGAARNAYRVRAIELDDGPIRAVLDAGKQVIYATRPGPDVRELAIHIGTRPALWHIVNEVVERAPGQTFVEALDALHDAYAGGAAPRPRTDPGDWIEVGKSERGKTLWAVVCGPPSLDTGDRAGDIEAVYVDHRDRATNEDFRWDGSGWEFARTPQPGDADRYDRLRALVSQVRAGPPWILRVPSQKAGRRR